MKTAKIRCPSCGSSQAYIRRRTGQIVCPECGEVSAIKLPPEQVIKAAIVLACLFASPHVFAYSGELVDSEQLQAQQQREIIDSQEISRREERANSERIESQRQEALSHQEIAQENAQIERIEQERRRVGY